MSNNKFWTNWGGIAGAANTTTVPSPLQYAQQSNVPFPQSQPYYQAPFILQVPVIQKSYSEKLHFLADDGTIHSHSVEEIFKLLGLSW